MKKALAATAAIALLAAGAVIAAPAASATTCNDGSWSNSSGRGTCSWHGGIDRGRTAAATATAQLTEQLGNRLRLQLRLQLRQQHRNYGNSGRGYSNYDYGSPSSSIYGYDNYGW